MYRAEWAGCTPETHVTVCPLYSDKKLNFLKLKINEFRSSDYIEKSSEKVKAEKLIQNYKIHAMFFYQPVT